MSDVVLALDIASCCGWAVDGPKRNTRGEPFPLSGSFRPGPAIQGDFEYGPTYVAFRDWIVDLCTVHRPRYAIFEAPLPFAGGSTMKAGVSSPATVRKLLGLAAVVEEALTRLEIETLEANVQTVRKHFCGDPRARKPDVVRTCRILGWHPSDDNAADALALWDFARAALKLGGSPGTLLGRESA